MNLPVLLLLATAVGTASGEPYQGIDPPARRRVAALKLQLNGAWVQKAYVDSIRTHHSPFRAHTMLVGVTDLSFLSLRDSVMVGWNNHEVLAGHAEVDLEATGAWSAGAPSRLGVWRAETDGASLRFEPGQGDTLLLCIGEKESWPLVKVSPKSSMGLESWVQQVLFGGRFTLQDRSGRYLSHDVGFAPDGTVTGMPGFSRYRVWTDYNDDVPRMDLIVFESETGAPAAWYTWERTPATITLYKLSEGEPSAAATRGDPEFELTRLTDPRGGFGSPRR